MRESHARIAHDSRMAVGFLTCATCKNVRKNLIPRAHAYWTSLITSSVDCDIGADILARKADGLKDSKAAEDFCLPCPWGPGWGGLGGFGASQGRQEHAPIDLPYQQVCWLVQL